MNLGRFELCLQVADIERSLGFYTKLGFHPVAGGAEHRVVVIRSGDYRIGLHQGHIAENLLTPVAATLPRLRESPRRPGLSLRSHLSLVGMAAWVLSCESPTGMPSILSPILRNKANNRRSLHKIWISNRDLTQFRNPLTMLDHHRVDQAVLTADREIAFPVTYSSLAVSNFHIVLEAERACILIISELAATRPCRTSS